MSTPKKLQKLAPIQPYERDHHQVECPMWGTFQLVKARVGIHTDFIRFLCKNVNCGGKFHMYPLNASIRATNYKSKLANQKDHEGGDSEDAVPFSPKGKKSAPKRRKPKAETPAPGKKKK